MNVARIENARLLCDEIKRRGEYDLEVRNFLTKNFGYYPRISYNGKPCYQAYYYTSNRFTYTMCQALQFLGEGIFEARGMHMNVLEMRLRRAGWDLRKISFTKTIHRYRLERI